MELLITGVLLLLAASWVAYPIVRPGPATSRMQGTHGRTEAPELCSEKDRLYRAAQDLDFDFHAGKVSEQDFREMTGALHQQALVVQEALGCTEARQLEEDAAERALRAKREQRRVPNSGVTD